MRLLIVATLALALAWLLMHGALNMARGIASAQQAQRAQVFGNDNANE